MTAGYRFEQITNRLTFTLTPPPTFRDKFHRVLELVQSFNNHMHHIIIAGWVSCGDESMSVWENRSTCPAGWIYCPTKPHPDDNEYHSICDGLSGIMYYVEMVEGKDRPHELSKKEFHKEGGTAALLLHMTKNLFGTEKMVILDSGFCVL
eukprot:15341779-Ditylum_brightwellii.AAC.1